MDRSKAIIILLAINLLAVLYIGYSINSSIRSNNDQTAAELRELKQQTLQLEGRITDGIRRELAAQADKVERLDYALTGVDLAQGKATVGLQVALKEVSPSAIISVSVSREGQVEPLEAELEHQGGMQYGADVELSLEHNYNLTVWESSDAGQKQLNVDPRQLPLFDDMYRKRVEKESTGTALSNERLDADFAFLLKDMGIAGIELEQALLRIRQRGELLDEIDVTRQAVPRPAGYGEMEDHYRIAIASGQIDSSVTLEQFARDNGFDPDQHVPADQAGEPSPYQQYVLRHSIEFDKDYPELELTRESAGQLSFEWVLRFKDGYEHLN